jgi:hypothetical protein
VLCVFLQIEAYGAQDALVEHYGDYASAEPEVALQLSVPVYFVIVVFVCFSCSNRALSCQ